MGKGVYEQSIHIEWLPLIGATRCVPILVYIMSSDLLIQFAQKKAMNMMNMGRKLWIACRWVKTHARAYASLSLASENTEFKAIYLLVGPSRHCHCIFLPIQAFIHRHQLFSENNEISQGNYGRSPAAHNFATWVVSWWCHGLPSKTNQSGYDTCGHMISCIQIGLRLFHQSYNQC